MDQRAAKPAPDKTTNPQRGDRPKATTDAMPLDGQLSLVDEVTLEARAPIPIDLQPTLAPDLTIRRVNPKTAAQYRTDLLLFLEWAKANHRLGLPARSDDVADYIEALAGGKTKLTTIRRRLASIVKWHAQRHLPNPRYDTEVKRALSLAYIEDERGYQRPYAAMDTAIRKMVFALNETYQKHVSPTHAMTLSLLRNQAILLTSFHAALSPTELVTLAFNQFEKAPNGDGITLRVNSSGFIPGTLEWVNPQRTRDVTIRPALDPTMCAITALLKWLKVAEIDEGFVFRPIDRAGRLGPHLSRVAIRDIVRYCMSAAGISPDRTSGHSLRSGLAGTLARNGAKDEVIREATGLKVISTMRDVVSKAREIAKGRVPEDYLKL